jgi:hypothetical protein
MPEAGGANIEIAHGMTERNEHAAPHAAGWLEIAEAIVLALVAIATAWSGYEAALWSGHQAQLYGEASKRRVRAAQLELLGRDQRDYDSSVVVEWMKASQEGKQDLARFFERRVRAEARPAFEAWKATDPVHNPDAPAGPSVMPEYHNANMEQSAKVNEEASVLFDRGTRSRDRSDDYVRVTVYLATVLLLTAIGQRFHIHKVRVVLATVAIFLLCSALARILTLPRV